MSDNSKRIAEIRSILQAGASSVSVDGVTVSYDFAALRQELRDLMANDPAFANKRPVVTTLGLGNF